MFTLNHVGCSHPVPVGRDCDGWRAGSASLSPLALTNSTAGTELSRLDSFLLDYSTTSHHVQHLDPNFNAFIWTTLLNQSSISVALLQPQPTTSTATVHTFKLTPLTTDQLGLHRQDLVNLYGDQLRVLVNQDEAWQAITGSHEHVRSLHPLTPLTRNRKPTLLTPVVYELLQLVTRARGEGCTVIEIGKTLGIDQKSAFHYVASIVTLGIVYVPAPYGTQRSDPLAQQEV